MLQAANRGYTTATDLADNMVKNLKITFRESYKITSKIVNLAEKLNLSLEELKLDQVQKEKNEGNFKLEFNKLWIHGLVHLFGHDHKKDKDYNIMKNVEKRFLSYLN